MVIEIHMAGAYRFARSFSRFASEVRDMSPAFELVHPQFLQMNKDNFRAKGKPHRWKPLTPRYAAWKRKHYPAMPLMRRRDRLIRSLTIGRGASERDAIKQIKKTWARFGTSVPYADYHQNPAPGGRLPKREVVQPTDRDYTRWSQTIHEWAWKMATGRIG